MYIDSREFCSFLEGGLATLGFIFSVISSILKIFDRLRLHQGDQLPVDQKLASLLDGVAAALGDAGVVHGGHLVVQDEPDSAAGVVAELQIQAPPHHSRELQVCRLAVILDQGTQNNLSTPQSP